MMPTDKNIELTINEGHAASPPKAAKKILDEVARVAGV